MRQQDDNTACERDRPVFFKVHLYADRLAEIYQRRKRGDRRALAQWLDDGLELALNANQAEVQRLVLQSGHMREVQLFCALAALRPDGLFGTWYWLWERVGSDERYWVFPSHADDDELDGQYLEPYLDKEALCENWRELLSAAEIQARARQT